MSISVVIPTLNEAAHIEDTLASVLTQSDTTEVIVVDGGSVDSTVEIARRFVRVVEAPKGRATQMNAGAELATGEILVFLHADTKLPENGLSVIQKTLCDASTLGGCFKLGFDNDSFWMRVWSWDAWMHWHRFAFGDRAIFVRRSTFEAVGRYPDQPMFEDLDLVGRIRRVGRFAFLDERVETSARRFQMYGTVGQQIRNALLWWGWLLGLSPHRLKRFYSDERDERGVPLDWSADSEPSLARY